MIRLNFSIIPFLLNTLANLRPVANLISPLEDECMVYYEKVPCSEYKDESLFGEELRGFSSAGRRQ